jgi:23S rRNA (uridine2552-2'-O)-methyltransferase
MSKSSYRWLQEHHNDFYVKQAKKEGWRSRAVYKLIEIDEKERLIKQGAHVLELGAAPGGWTEYVAQAVGKKGKVIASDILDMAPIESVDFVQGDFTDDAVFDQLMGLVPEGGVDVVISDMAPNMSGNAGVDIPKSMYLVELAVDMAMQTLAPKGDFFCKVFQGEGFDALVADVKKHFTTVKIKKPKASRSRSKEVYLLGRGFLGQ